MDQAAAFAGYTVEEISGKLFVHLCDIQTNPKRFGEAAKFLGRTVDTLRTWITKGKAELVGETIYLALGLLEKAGQIPRLPTADNKDPRTALAVAIAHRQVNVSEIARELGHDSSSRLFAWMRTGEMTGFSKIRLQWALSKKGVFDWSWLLKLPHHVQRVMAFAALNPNKNLQSLVDLIPPDLAGRSAVKSLAADPTKHVNSELREALKRVTPEIPDYVTTTNAKQSVPEEHAPTECTVDEHIANLDLKHRVLAGAAMLLADLRLLMGGSRDANPAPIAAVLDTLRKGDRTEVLFKLENVLGVVNTADDRAISRWLREEIH